jgi:AcrR family transcriptional regulator
VTQTSAKSNDRTDARNSRARILNAAKALFSSKGYERTTIRGVARAARIHPSLVIRYFRNKARLFAAAVTFDLRLPDLTATPKSKLGVTLVQHFLERWEGQAAGNELPSLIRAAVTYPEARTRMVQIFEKQVAPYIRRVCSPKKASECAALIATQLVGLAYTRYVLRFPAVIQLEHDAIVRRVGATLQSYLR